MHPGLFMNFQGLFLLSMKNCAPFLLPLWQSMRKMSIQIWFYRILLNQELFLITRFDIMINDLTLTIVLRNTFFNSKKFRYNHLSDHFIIGGMRKTAIIGKFPRKHIRCSIKNKNEITLLLLLKNVPIKQAGSNEIFDICGENDNCFWTITI